MTDTLGLGKLIEGKAERDAIHIAVAPVTADSSHNLYPGGPIALTGEGDKVTRCSWDCAVGIVDPFLMQTVYPGDRFWMWLKPYTITSLRHDWTHPAFKDDTVSSEMWLRVFAANHRTDYEYMLQEIVSGGHVCFGDESYREDCNDEFWHHVEQVIGKCPDREEISSNFRCAC